MEGALIERLAGSLTVCAPEPGADDHVVPIHPLDVDDLGLRRQVDLHLVREVLVVRVGGQAEAVSASLEVVLQAVAVDLHELGGQAPHRPCDHRVGDLRLQLRRDLLEQRPLDPGEQPPVLLLALPGQPLHPGIGVVVVLETGDAGPREPQDQTLVAGERRVPVLGNRLPAVSSLELRPPPLPPVSIPIADHEVEEPRLQEGADVRSLLGRSGHDGIELVVVEDPDGSLEPGIPRGPPLRVLEELPDDAGELLTVRTEPFVVRHDDEPRLRMQDPRGLHQLVDDVERDGVAAHDLVLGEAADPGVTQLLGDH